MGGEFKSLLYRLTYILLPFFVFVIVFVNVRVNVKVSVVVYHPSGSTTLSSRWAALNSGAISSSWNPAMPQPILVTRKVSSGCSLAKSMN